MTTAQRIHLRLFIEGVEVPVISASVSSQANTPAAATIQIPANDLALQIKPRSLVHLFFYDFYRGAPPSDRAWVAGDGVSIETRDRDPELEDLIPPERLAATEAQLDTDLDNQNYRLLFGGEVVGVNVEKTPMSRGITLQCLDWSMYWDYAFQYQVSGYSLGGGGMRAAFTGASTTLFNSFLDSDGDIIVGLMTTPPRSYPRLVGTLLGAITHIIEAMGGVNFGRRSIRGVNDFFSIAELRLHLTQMVGANPFEQVNERNLMRANGFGSLFARTLGGLGRQVSIRDILNALQRFIFHEVIPTTSPRYIPPLVDPNLPTFETSPITGNTAYASVVSAARLLKDRALSLKSRQERATTPEQADNLSAERGGLATELDRLVAACGRAAGIARRLATRQRTTFVGDLLIHQILVVNATRFQRIKEKTRRAQRPGVRTNTFFGPETAEGQEVIQLAGVISADMESILTAQIRSRIQLGALQPDPPARLITQIYRPDVWMVAPPRCNVLFPELYNNFNYGRTFMDEVTRLMLRTSNAFYGSDVLFDGFYMAPSRSLGVRTGRGVAGGRAGLEPPDLSDAPAYFVRDMMNHELYTGIIPKFERMNDLNLHALRGGSVELQPGDGGPAIRVGYAQLACNHIFFKYRFMSRQLNCAGKFNPFFALGFPALIVDKYRAADVNDAESEVNNEIARRIAARAREGEGAAVSSTITEDEASRQREMADSRYTTLYEELAAQQPNTHYLGTPIVMQHTVSAEQGGNTSIQMAYARSTDETTEFLGDDRLPAPTRYSRTRNIIVTTTVGMSVPPQTGTTEHPVRGPRGGEILHVTDVTEEFQRDHPVHRVRGRRSTSATGEARYTSSARLPLFIQGPSSGRRFGTRVLIGQAVPASSVPEAAALVGTVGGFNAASPTVTGTGNDGDPATVTSLTLTFRAYRIREQVGVYRRTAVDLPAEDLVFPPWYGENYRSQNIGSLYAYFFGTGSVVDHLVAVNLRGAQADGGDPSGAAAATPSGAGADGSVEQGVLPGVTTPEDPTPPEVQQSVPQTIGAPGTAEEPGVPIGAITEHSALADAIRSLVDIYSQVRRNRFDVDDFLRSYTWRPIASMVDIFGTANLEIDDDGEVVQGVEGFHSRAFGDFDDLRQLTRTVDGDRVATILNLSTTDTDEADGAAADRALRDTDRARRLDTRKEKRLAIYRYLQALLATRGILG